MNHFKMLGGVHPRNPLLNTLLTAYRTILGFPLIQRWILTHKTYREA